MSKALLTTIILWITSFTLISFFHSYMYHLEMNAIPGFYSTYSDVFAIGGLLSFFSFSASFLLFVWLIYLIRKSDRTRSNLIRINIILFVSSLIAFFLAEYVTASGFEALCYVSIYAVAFAGVINFYFRSETRLTGTE